MALRIGSIISERYRIDRLIGSGGNGSVYLAFDLVAERLVAIKILAADFWNSTEGRRRFDREFKIAGALQHPNLLPIYESGSYEGIDFHVMDYCEAGTLSGILFEPVLPQGIALDFMKQVAAGVRELHQHNILHRDLKASNVLIGSEGQALISDFGLALWQSNDVARTRSFGTPLALAPELWNGEESSVESDIYALGVLFYRIATSREPFKADSIAEVAHRHIYETPLPPSHFTEISPVVEYTIGRMLSKNKHERFNSLQEVCELLDDSGSISLSDVTDSLAKNHKSLHSANTIVGLLASMIIVAGFLRFVFTLIPELDKFSPTNSSLSFFEIRTPLVYQYRHFFLKKEGNEFDWKTRISIDKFEVVQESGERILKRLRVGSGLVEQFSIQPEGWVQALLREDISECSLDLCQSSSVTGYQYAPFLPGRLGRWTEAAVARWFSSGADTSLINYGASGDVVEVEHIDVLEARKFDDWDEEDEAWIRSPFKPGSFELQFPIQRHRLNKAWPKLFLHQWPFKITNKKFPSFNKDGVKYRSLLKEPKQVLLIRTYSDCRGELSLFDEYFWKRCNWFKDTIYGKAGPANPQGPLLEIRAQLSYKYDPEIREPKIEDYTKIRSVSIAAGPHAWPKGVLGHELF